MSNKRRVVITIQHRGSLSLGSNRARLGYAAYHWGIVVQRKHSKGPGDAYDVSDAIVSDPKTRQDLLPNCDWRFRPQPKVNLFLSGRLLGRIMIGKVPKHVTRADIEAILRTVPLPLKNTTPEQNCVTWAVAAIRALQQHGLAEIFDLDHFLASALQQGDAWLKDPGSDNFYNYTNRPD